MLSELHRQCLWNYAAAPRRRRDAMPSSWVYLMANTTGDRMFPLVLERTCVYIYLDVCDWVSSMEVSCQDVALLVPRPNWRR